MKIPFLQPLSAVLPDEEQTLLLQACLWSGEHGEQAWSTWSARIGDPAEFLRQDKDGVKALLPLLFDSLQHTNVPVVEEFRTYLRTAYLRDELRSKAYSRICRNVVETLTKGGLQAVVLKGAALAETCYKTPSLQHAHHLDILIKENDRGGAVEILRPLKFTSANTPPASQFQSIELVHESGLPLMLHSRLFQLISYSVDMDEIWARSQIETISDVPVRLLSPQDNLFHICGSVLDMERHESLRWVCDAWFLIQRNPNLDWNLLLECACRSRMVLPLFVTAHYLAESLKARIPTGFLRALHTAASNATPLEREVALYSIQTNARGGLKTIIQNCDNWSSRTLVLKWAFLPSSDYMRSIHDVRWSFLLPVYYVYRPLRYLVRSSWFFGKRLVRRLSESRRALRAVPKVVSS